MLFDLCFCYTLVTGFRKFKKSMLKRWRKWMKLGNEEEEEASRPESMWYYFDSSSDGSSEEGEAGGINKCTVSLGEGATLYLQTMKTLCIMFVILSIINIPLYAIYSSTEKHPNWTNLSDIFKLTTLGNLGKPDLKCGYSDLKNDMIYGTIDRSPEVKLKCDDGEYINKILSFGLLYLDDK